MNEENFKKRIEYSGEIETISLQLCKDYGLGDFSSNKLVLMGYEDFNFILETDKGKHFVKVYGAYRDLDECKRYVEIMKKASEAQISTPKLYKSDQGYLHTMNVDGTELRLSVMEFIDGKTFYELKEKLTVDETKFLAHQAALVNSMDIKPKFVYDSWSITSFVSEFEKKSKYLSDNDLKLVESSVQRFKELNIEKLPHSFVHGDFLTTNVMKDNNDKLWIIDFAVSNYYPRIQELAVLGCNLLFDENDKKITDRNFNVALEEYQNTVKLTQEELDFLPTYIEFAHAMHLIEANYEKVNNNNQSEENEYWLNQGRIGLKQMVNK
ncbi:MAG: phosphotransferase [Candidatus Aenigmarchaeota archaeon]|nr:phosphotransferase [Candidatus Aenigmarchaeota archaeon]